MKCPECKSENIQKIGYRITRKEGRKQRYQCQKCAKTFYGEGVK